MLRSFTQAIKAWQELGSTSLGLYLWYKLGLMSGYLRWRTDRDCSRAVEMPPGCTLVPVISLPNRDDIRRVLGAEGLQTLQQQADEIVSGNVRLFGDDPVPLQLAIDEQLQHWTDVIRGGDILRVGDDKEEVDIKLVWEPARFGWAFTLARAYYVTGEERYTKAFWEYLETFLIANPPNWGPNWVSAQEVALRILSFVFAAQVFASATTNTVERQRMLAQAVAAHAARIPATLAYARAQNNNHLLLEAIALYTASLALPTHPQSKKWREMGRTWIYKSLLSQISPDGAYVQHSTNYHRVLLQAGLWAYQLAKQEQVFLEEVILHRLRAATQWLLNLIDPVSGRAPNLGPNDGAYILPLSNADFWDYRPVLQGAASIFLGSAIYALGQGDEMCLWLGEPALLGVTKPLTHQPEPAKTGVLRHPLTSSWAYLRAVHFTSRPGHADQLHLDLWWRGINLALDAGTYRYNASSPWDNALSQTSVHNTLVIQGKDQMSQAGRFLWLDWAQARIVTPQETTKNLPQLVAWHDGYRSKRVIHQRIIDASAPQRWLVRDAVLPVSHRKSLSDIFVRYARTGDAKSVRVWSAALHWLVPDLPWEVIQFGQVHFEVHLESPNGVVQLHMWCGENTKKATFRIVRSGELIYGEGLAYPEEGWFSPTYNRKNPALSVTLEATGGLPLEFFSEWRLPETPKEII